MKSTSQSQEVMLGNVRRGNLQCIEFFFVLEGQRLSLDAESCRQDASVKAQEIEKQLGAQPDTTQQQMRGFSLFSPIGKSSQLDL